VPLTLFTLLESGRHYLHRNGLSAEHQQGDNHNSNLHCPLPARWFYSIIAYGPMVVGPFLLREDHIATTPIPTASRIFADRYVRDTCTDATGIGNMVLAVCWEIQCVLSITTHQHQCCLPHMSCYSGWSSTSITPVLVESSLVRFWEAATTLAAPLEKRIRDALVSRNWAILEPILDRRSPVPAPTVCVNNHHGFERRSTTSRRANTREQSSQRSLSGSIVS
jgi:hypothetical protein